MRGQPFLVGTGPLARAICASLSWAGGCVAVVLASLPWGMDMSGAPRARGAALDWSRARMGCPCLAVFVGSRKSPAAPRSCPRTLAQSLGGALRPVEPRRAVANKKRSSGHPPFACVVRPPVAIV